MCFRLKKLIKPTDYEVHSMSWPELTALLASKGLELMLKDQFAPDYTIYYSTEEGWVEIIPFLTYPAEYYIEERTDCDDYAKKASADASFEFGLTCIQAWGGTPYGHHAFNLVVVSPTEIKLFEPNAGFDCAGILFDQNNLWGWVPESWKP